MADLIRGYEADIYQGIWKRPMTLGAPRVWASIWVVLCLYGALMALFVYGLGWLLLIGLGWLIGQGVLVALTYWDEDWDAVVIAKAQRRNHAYYDAG